jgi:hypothetical protein
MQSNVPLQSDLVVCPNGGGLYAVPKSAVARDYHRGTPISSDLWRAMTANASSRGPRSFQTLVEPLLYPGSVVVVTLGHSWMWCMRFGVDAPAFLRPAAKPHKTGWRMLWPIDVRTAREFAKNMAESASQQTSVLVNQFAPPAQGEWPLLKNALHKICPGACVLLEEEAWFLANLNFCTAEASSPAALVLDTKAPRGEQARALPSGANPEGVSKTGISRTRRGGVGPNQRRLQLQALPVDLQILIFKAVASDVVLNASGTSFREWKNLRLLSRASRWAADRVVRDWMNAVADGSGLGNGSLSTPGQCVYMHRTACESGLSATRLFQMVLHDTRTRTPTPRDPSDCRSIALDFAKARAGLRFHAKLPAQRQRQSNRLLERSSRKMGVKLRMRDKSGEITFFMHAISK